MIFATVGTQLPFNRLIKTLDEWAVLNSGVEIFAQTGITEYEPKEIKWSRSLSKNEFDQRLKECSLVVAHAGIGSIISAIEMGKPIIVMPRKAALAEHRNDHQLATAEEFRQKDLVQVAFEELDLKKQLDAINLTQSSGVPIAPQASPQLLEKLRTFILSGV